MHFLDLPIELVHEIVLHLNHGEILDFLTLSSHCFTICDNAYFLSKKTNEGMHPSEDTVSWIPVYRKWYRKLNKTLIQTVAPRDFGYEREAGKEKVLQELVDAGANLNVCYHRMTPLQIAIENEESDMVKILLTAGSDVNAAGPWGLNILSMCFLHLSALDSNNRLCNIEHKYQKIFEILTMLLEYGADIPDWDDELMTFIINELFNSNKYRRVREILSRVTCERNPHLYNHLQTKTVSLDLTYF